MASWDGIEHIWEADEATQCVTRASSRAFMRSSGVYYQSNGPVIHKGNVHHGTELSILHIVHPTEL